MSFLHQDKSKNGASSPPRPRGEIHQRNSELEISKKPGVLPVLLSPSSLRPVVFRVFTKKHNLTVTASSLQLLASFVGKHCGAGWREDGLAEPVLDEIAKTWKRSGGGMIVEDARELSLSLLLRGIEERMSGGRLVSDDSKSYKPFATLDSPGKIAGHERAASDELDTGVRAIALEGGQSVSESADDVPDDPRRFIKVVSAFNQPRLIYNPQRRQFEQSPASPSLFPLQHQKAAVSRDHYHVIHQRLLHNEAFQTSTSELFGRQSNQSLKLTSIANLQGRSGSSHLLLGLLSPTPTGDLALTDPTGTISLDLRHAKAVPEGGVWFTPGMIVLVDGIYDEDETVSGSGLANASGIGGTIGGKFVGFSIGGPPGERREVSLGLSGPSVGDKTAAQGFGWTDFLGVGADRISGPGMRKIEDQYLQKTRPGESNNIRRQIVIMSEVNLDLSRTRRALHKVLDLYLALPEHRIPAVFILIGNFASRAVIGGQGTGGSIEYKENFNGLASLLSQYPQLLQRATFVFVPGDNDLWASSFSAGATSMIPKMPIPDMFTSRVQAAFNSANPKSRSLEKDQGGEAVWTTNPTRLSIFGPVRELVVFRDDISGRLRRTSLNFKKKDESDSNPTAAQNLDDNDQLPDPPVQPEVTPPPGDNIRTASQQATAPNISPAQKLAKTILDQGCLSPFPTTIRPILWNYASALQLYPLPSALVLADSEAEPFAITYEGCHVMNPGKLVPDSGTGTINWIEYDMLSNKGRACSEQL